MSVCYKRRFVHLEDLLSLIIYHFISQNIDSHPKLPKPTNVRVVSSIYGLERVAEHVLQLLITLLVHILAHDHSAVDYITPRIKQHLTLVECR